MSREHNFISSEKLGKFGEEILIFWLNDLKQVSFIKDARKKQEYREVDVDLFVTSNKIKPKKLSLWTPCELKADQYDSGNVTWEKWSSIEDKKIGCMEKTKCDLLFYYLFLTNEVYILKMEPYRDWFHSIENNRNICYPHQPKNHTWKDNVLYYYHSLTYTVKKSEIEKQPFLIAKIEGVRFEDYWDRIEDKGYFKEVYTHLLKARKENEKSKKK